MFTMLWKKFRNPGAIINRYQEIVDNKELVSNVSIYGCQKSGVFRFGVELVWNNHSDPRSPWLST